MDAAIGTLMLLGAVSIIAAVVGGNVKLPGGTEFAGLRHPALRGVLAIVGVSLMVFGSGLYVVNRGSPPSAPPATVGFSRPPSTPNPAVAAETSTQSPHNAYLQQVKPICEAASRAGHQIPDFDFNDLAAIESAYLAAARIETLESSQLKAIPRPPAESEHSGCVKVSGPSGSPVLSVVADERQTVPVRSKGLTYADAARLMVSASLTPARTKRRLRGFCAWRTPTETGWSSPDPEQPNFSMARPLSGDKRGA